MEENGMGSAPMLNVSNHPSSMWAMAQIESARRLASTIIDLPPPEASPDATTDEILAKARGFIHCIPAGSSIAMVSTEYTMTVALVALLQSIGISCFAATTQRDVIVSPEGVKTSVFKFLGFREYPAIRLITAT
jgi:hypothetical protein